MVTSSSPVVTRRSQRLSGAIADSRVLVVDDTAFNRELIGAYLTEAGLRDVIYAADGLQAIEAVRMTMPDLVVLDIMMPGIDGFEVCRLLRSDPATAELPILVQTALTSSEDRNKAFTVGATDLVPKPIDPNELLARVRIHLENRHLIADLRQYRMRVEGELEIARSMFDHLMPSTDLCGMVEGASGVTIRHQVLKGLDICGDFWGLVPLGGRRFGVYLADTPGRGLATALGSFRLHTLLNDALPVADQPARFLETLNERSVVLRESGEHASFLYGVIDVDRSSFVYAAAASSNPLMVSGGATPCAIGDASGLPIAIASGIAYRERCLDFPPGAALILYSNAVLDALPEREHALVALVARSVAEAGTRHAFHLVAETLAEICGGAPPDDHTLIWIARPPDPARA